MCNSFLLPLAAFLKFSEVGKQRLQKVWFSKMDGELGRRYLYKSRLLKNDQNSNTFIN